MRVHDPLMKALEELAEAAQGVASQCWNWDQLARELHDEFRHRYKGEGDGATGWMGFYIERLARYTLTPKEGINGDGCKTNDL